MIETSYAFADALEQAGSCTVDVNEGEVAALVAGRYLSDMTAS
jgi:hypothetical protein